MTRADVIVVGGGVAGLAAAGELGRRGYSVMLLEARDRLGGRILTARPKGWTGPVELGAEFVHGGNSPLWRRLRRHRLRTVQVPAHHWRFTAGTLQEVPDIAASLGRVTKAIAPRRMRGWSFAEFMRRNGKRFDAAERDLAAGFVEGFEAAPMDAMSAAALAGETLEDDEQFSVPEGYDRLIDGLMAELPLERVSVRVDHPVRSIVWRPDPCVVTVRRQRFAADAVLLTVPIGVWQAGARARGGIRFKPRLRVKERLARRIGAGQVVRLSIRFRAAPWRQLLPALLHRTAKNGFGFIHSRLESVPVWWSLSGAPVLTGWAGGPAAMKLAGQPRSVILARALESLACVFTCRKTELRAAIADWQLHNWTRDPFSRCAYSFVAARGEDAAARFREPVRNALFFAGEATADGEEIGTVHGALASGLRAAQEIAARIG